MQMEELVEKVWKKGKIVAGYNEGIIRKDCCGAWIIHDQYGNRDSDYGWEIDHVYPKSKGGGDDLINLRPMQWENNMSKGDYFPSYPSCICAAETENISFSKQLTVNERLVEQLKQQYHFNEQG